MVSCSRAERPSVSAVCPCRAPPASSLVHVHLFRVSTVSLKHQSLIGIKKNIFCIKSKGGNRGTFFRFLVSCRPRPAKHAPVSNGVSFYPCPAFSDALIAQHSCYNSAGMKSIVRLREGEVTCWGHFRATGAVKRESQNGTIGRMSVGISD